MRDYDPWPYELHPSLMIDPTTGARVPRAMYEAWRRRKLLGFQRPCPRCGARIGEPCVSPSGTERRYVTTHDDGHHTDRIPRSDWTVTR